MDLFGGFGGPFDFNGDGMMDPEELAVAMDCLDGDETGDLDSEAEDSSAFMPASLYGKEIEFGEETERNFEVFDMKKIYFTITGLCFRHGSEFLEPEMEVTLVKEPDNKVDKEAIKVEMPGLGQIGYVANSTRTVLGESMSAGRLYDKIGDTAKGTVLYVLPEGVICILDPKSIVNYEGFDAKN